MMKTCFDYRWVSIISLFLSLTASNAEVPWHPKLSLDNRGYWPARASVEIANVDSTAVIGQGVSFSVPALAGFSMESLRVCRADGTELLYELHSADGKQKRNGQLAPDDLILVPMEAEFRTSTNLFIYAGNQRAWPVPDFLKSKPGSPASTTVRVGKIEELKLKTGSMSKIKLGPDFLNHAVIIARNFSATPAASALVRVNLQSVLACFPPAMRLSELSVMDADGKTVPAYRFGTGNDLLIECELPPLSEQTFRIGFKSAGKTDMSTRLRDYARLLQSSANKIPQNYLSGDTSPFFSFSNRSTDRAGNATAGVSDDAKFGRQSLELTIGTNPGSQWLGRTSKPIPVKPGATYYLSGWMKSMGLKSSATIHAHFHAEGGALCKSGAMASTGPAVSGESEWTQTRSFLTAPPDAAFIRLHLTMNTQGTLRHSGLLFCEVLDGVPGHIHSQVGQNPDRNTAFHVWEVNPLIKVFPETPPQNQARKITVELAQNEFEPFQLAIRGRFGEGLSNAQIGVAPVIGKQGSTRPMVKVERVGFVPVDYPSGYYRSDLPDWCRKTPHGSGSTDGWAGEWPDPLIPNGPFDIGQNRTQPVWFTVQATSNMPAGDYDYAITIEIQDKAPLSIPLVVKVLPFALPDKTQLKAIFDFRRGPGGWQESGADTPEGRKKWLRFIGEHRLGINSIEPSPKFAYKDGKVTMDATEFDETARFCFDELGMNASYTPNFFYMFGWAYPPKKMFGLDPFTPEWLSAFKQAYGLFTDHLRQKGWHDKFIYYISDEPHFDQKFVVDQMKRLCDLIHEVDRTIPIYSSTWRHCPEWDAALDLWGVGQYGCFPVSEIQRLQKAGKQMLWTCDGQQATDTPYLATERMLPYYCLKYGVKGFEFWGISWWTYDPWKLGWHWFIRQSDDGKRQYWIRYPNGDGYLAYPGKPVGVDGPVSTIRLEQVREGLEDYEAMSLLTQILENNKMSPSARKSAERALAMARDLVSIPNSGGLRSSEILPDPDQVPAIRKAVNKALVESLKRNR